MTDYSRAACRGSGVDFFDEENEWPAIMTCNGCAVREECLADCLRDERGLPDQHLFGVYGGATPDDRARMRISTVRQKAS
jgi:hypothetical protein